MTVNDKRIVGIDLLKILSMILITIIHYTEYNDALVSAQGLYKFFLNLLVSATCIAVNLFTVVTGYLMCEKERDNTRIIKIWSEGWFYSVILLIPGIVIMRGKISIGNIIRIFFPVLSQHYWYLTMIVFVYLLSPILNSIISFFTESLLKRAIIISGFIITVIFAANPFIPEEIYLGHPHGFVWLVYLYFVGAYIKKYLRPVNKLLWMALAGICFIFIFLLRWFNICITNISLTSQYSIFPALLTVSVFILLKDIKFDFLKNINRIIAECSFGVYLIQEHCLFRDWFWTVFDVNHAGSIPRLLVQLSVVLLVLWISSFILHTLYRLLYTNFRKLTVGAIQKNRTNRGFCILKRIIYHRGCQV